MHATDYVSATGGVTASAADHRQAFIGTDARARFPVYDLRQGPVMTKKKKLEIRFLVRTPISYIRRGPFIHMCSEDASPRGADFESTQARPPGPALADAPEADLVRRLGAAGPAVRDEEGDQFTGWRHRRADGAGLVVSQIDGPAGRAAVQVVEALRPRRRAAR